ncbi:GntR family transcriptional regulator [Salibacterium lacus]|uniref:GntR family transcriptional regulator n=1 Tax=Salibacterium lacus TaxID=1898109 RepID=A0ABW5T6H0_9BACI
MENNSAQNVSVRSYVYDKLKSDIMKLIYKPGQRITENVVSDHLNVSRTPVREAFLKLSEERLIEVYPQRGTYVSLINKKLVEESVFIRENLELAIVKLALQQFDEYYMFMMEKNLAKQREYVDSPEYVQLFDLDQEFHEILFAGVDKFYSWSIIENSMVNYNRIRMLSLISSVNWQLLINQHEEIFNSIKEKDEEKGITVMKDHLSRLTIDIEKIEEKFPDYF